MERAWESTFREPLTGFVPADPDPGGFRSLLTALAAGYPIGYAMEALNLRRAELSTDLADALFPVQHQGLPRSQELDRRIARLWTANNDARDYIIVGDPAVHSPVGTDSSGARAREVTPIPLSAAGRAGHSPAAG